MSSQWFGKSFQKFSFFCRSVSCYSMAKIKQRKSWCTQEGAKDEEERGHQKSLSDSSKDINERLKWKSPPFQSFADTHQCRGKALGFSYTAFLFIITRAVAANLMEEIKHCLQHKLTILAGDVGVLQHLKIVALNCCIAKGLNCIVCFFVCLLRDLCEWYSVAQSIDYVVARQLRATI